MALRPRHRRVLFKPGTARRAAPNFTFTDLGGERVSLADLRGQVVIVLFGDLGCAPCRENDRLLRQYQLEYLTHTHDLVVISLHERATLEELQRYDAGFTFSTLTGLDPGQEIARRYHASPLPVTVFIDRDGPIREVCPWMRGHGAGVVAHGPGVVLPQQAGSVDRGPKERDEVQAHPGERWWGSPRSLIPAWHGRAAPLSVGSRTVPSPAESSHPGGAYLLVWAHDG